MHCALKLMCAGHRYEPQAYFNSIDWSDSGTVTRNGETNRCLNRNRGAAAQETFVVIKSIQ